MASREPVVTVPVAPGMREDIDPTLLPPGTLRYLQNARCYQQGKLEKRPGTKLLATSGLPDDGQSGWLSQQGGRAIAGIQVADSGDRINYKVYAQQTAADTASWGDLGSHGGIVPVRRFSVSPQTTTGVKHLSCARIGDLLYVSFTDVASEVATVQLVTLDGTVLRGRQLSFARNSRLLYVNSVLYIFYCNSASAGGDDLEARIIDQSDLSFGSASTIATTGGNDFDVAPLEGSATDFLLVATDGTTAIGVYRLSSPSTTVASISITAAAAASLVGIAGYTGTHVMVGWVEGGSTGNVRVSFRNPTTLANVSTSTIDTSPGNENLRYQVCFVRRTASEWIVTFGGSDTTSASPTVPYAYFKFGTANSGTLSVGTPQKAVGFGLASKPFLSGAGGEASSVYVWAHTQGDATKWRTQAAHYVISCDTSAIGAPSQARLEAVSYEHIATYSPSTSFMSQLPTVENFGGLFATPLNWADPNLTGVDVAIFTAARRTDSIAGVHRFAGELSGALVVSGGWLYEHTGARGSNLSTFLTENGFAYDPELTTALAAGGSLTSGQEYTYRALYRWTDALGRVHRSAPSDPVTATPSGGNLTVRVAAAPLRLSGRFNITIASVEVEYYRAWLGGPYYYCGSVALGSTTEPVLVDTSADSTVESNITLYTDSGFIPTDPPSGARLWCHGGSRVFVVGWRENVVQFSKLLIPTAPIEFCDDDTFRVFLPEPITAIAYLDGTLVVFCNSGIYTVSGDGPSDQGVGQYGEPQRMPASASCDDARSLLETPQGLMFKGGGTIWLLPRGFAPPVPVGDAIARTLATYPFCQSACLTHEGAGDGAARVAHFTVADSDDPDDQSTAVLAFDTDLGAWSVDLLGGSPIGGAGAVDGSYCWAAGEWGTASAELPLRRFSVDEAQDYDASGGSTWIETRFEFGDFRPFGPLGWGRTPRVQFLGQVFDACTLTLEVYRNEEPELIDEFVSPWAGQKEFTGGANTVYLEHGFKDTLTNSLQLTLYDGIGTGMGAVPTRGYALRALAFDAVPEAGMRRATAATERF